jgi:flagellar biosynthesis chaperone FliJ
MPIARDLIERIISDYSHDNYCDESVGVCNCDDPSNKKHRVELSTKIASELEKEENFHHENYKAMAMALTEIGTMFRTPSCTTNLTVKRSKEVKELLETICKMIDLDIYMPFDSLPIRLKQKLEEKDENLIVTHKRIKELIAEKDDVSRKFESEVCDAVRLRERVATQSKLIKDYENKYHEQQRVIRKHYSRIQGQNEEIAKLKTENNDLSKMNDKYSAMILVLRNEKNQKVCDELNERSRRTFFVNMRYMHSRKRHSTLKDAIKHNQRNQVILRVTDCYKVKEEVERINYESD